jgi:hypothetical protein
MFVILVLLSLLEETDDERLGMGASKDERLGMGASKPRLWMGASKLGAVSKLGAGGKRLRGIAPMIAVPF